MLAEVLYSLVSKYVQLTETCLCWLKHSQLKQVDSL